MPARAVGIDLGTTNSLMAMVNAQGHSEMLRDHEGRLHVPSVVLFDEEKVIVGEEARLRGRGRPHRLAACAKLDLGKRFYSQPLGSQHLAPEVIEACILRQLKVDISQRIGHDFAAVIGVPAHFNDVQRRATVEAAEMAGIRLLDVLNEPVAAALAFREHGPPQPREAANVLVYDLGGYTFEATLLRCEGSSFITLATDHDNLLGGNDWDLRLADCLAEEFLQEYRLDLRSGPAGLDLLFVLAARAKTALGMRPATTIMAPRDGVMCSVNITRAQFERRTQRLLERTLDRCQRVLAQAGMTWTDVSRILLVGGATRMPMIRRALQERSGRGPELRVNPDEAICRGAALYAAHLLGQHDPSQALRPVQIANISTHSLGIEGVDPRSGKRMNRVIIPRGTPLPARVSKEFVTKANAQRSISITVLEGESQHPQHCTPIGRAVLRDLPADLTIEWPVEVTCEYAASGRLTVDARLRYTDRTVHLELVRPCGVSQAHLERWKGAVSAAAGFRVFEELARREWQEAAPPPIALAVSPPEDVAKEGRIASFLHRYMPFVFRSEPTPGAADGH